MSFGKEVLPFLTSLRGPRLVLEKERDGNEDYYGEIQISAYRLQRSI